MFKLLWSNPSPPKGREEAGQAVPDGDRLKMLAEHFPIGRKVRYFPEYQRDIVFHTIVIAWRVNDQDIYAREAILEHLEDLEDTYLAEEALEEHLSSGGRTISTEELLTRYA